MEVVNTLEYKHLYAPIDFDKSIRCEDDEKNMHNLEMFNKIKFDPTKLEMILLSKDNYITASIDNNGNIKPFTVYYK